MTKEDLSKVPIVRETLTHSLDKKYHHRIRIHETLDGKYWFIDQRMNGDQEMPNNYTIMEVSPVAGTSEFHAV